MGKRTLELSDRLYEYMLSVSLRETALQKALREETDRLEMGEMQISADQGQFMAMLVRLTGAKRALEIGTFTGYSTLSVATALPLSLENLASSSSGLFLLQPESTIKDSMAENKNSFFILEIRLFFIVDMEYSQCLHHLRYMPHLHQEVSQQSKDCFHFQQLLL